VTAQADYTLWLLISTALLALAVAGVALFYGGMVRRKNVMNTMALPLSALACVSLAWSLFGDGLASGIDASTLLVPHSSTDPLLSLYRGMMASVALALLAGGVVERIRFSFFLIFGLCWIVTV
jgi:ammonium transporter, Amt family